MSFNVKIVLAASFVGAVASQLSARAEEAPAFKSDGNGQLEVAQNSPPAVDAAAAAASSQVVQVAQIEQVTVTGALYAAPEVAKVPGSAVVIAPVEVERGRVANIADALKYVPGLIADSQNGAEATRFSIRGSSIVRGAGSWGTGIQQLLDGLPMTTPAGSPYEYYDALPMRTITVLPGVNGFEYSPLTAGGAINYIPHTGYDSDLFQARAEFGSFGYNREQVSSGQVYGPLDYYISGTHFAQDGFRDRNHTYSWRIVADAGYQITSALKTRFYGVYAQQDTQNAAALTWKQLQADPTQNPTTSGNRHDIGSTLVANKTTYDVDDASHIEFGAIWKHYPLRNQGGSNPGNWDYTDLALEARYERQDTVFDGMSSETLFALLYSDILPRSTNKGYTPAYVLQQKDFFSGYDKTLLAQNDLEALSGLWVTTGIAAIWQMRGSNLVYPVTDNRTEHYFTFAPRLGLRYDVTSNLQLFGNVSRSVEAPIPLYLPQTVNNIYRSNADIKAQTQNTIEVGTRGQEGIFTWSLSAYNVHVKRELLTVQITPATPTTPAVTQTTNGSPTIHQGIEAALDIALWDSVTFHQSFTLNDFHYHDDPVWGHNTLAAVPKELYQAGLDYMHPSGLYAGLDVQAVFTRYPADFANTLFTPSYAVLGAKLGFAPPEAKWQIFLDVRNLTDRKYASATSSVFNAKGVDSAVYTPGVGRNISLGVQYAF